MGIQSWWNKIKRNSDPKAEPQSPITPSNLPSTPQDEPDLTKVFARVYMVELFFEKKPGALDDAKILHWMENLLGNVGISSKDDKDGIERQNSLLFRFLDHNLDFHGAQLPMQMLLMTPDKPAGTPPTEDPKYAMSFHQSWLFPEVRERMANCPYSMLVSDMMSSGLDPKERMYVFQRALWSIVQVMQPKAIHFQHSQQFMDAQTYLSNVPDSPNYDTLLGLLNVRMFNINDAHPGDMVMDTLGLSALGIPDLQVHFHDLDPNEVAGMLNGTGHYLFENGDVIEDGHTLSGWDPAQRWRCQHETSLLEPYRIVVDVNPGAPYVAGGRT